MMWTALKAPVLVVLVGVLASPSHLAGAVGGRAKSETHVAVGMEGLLYE